jgi:pimeloyl-ACP methyl ester carboxylesterase
MPSERIGSIRGHSIGPVASFDGTELHVEVLGNGPTVVLAHGFCMDIPSWHYTLKELSSEYRFVAYCQRGHGLSARAPTDDYTMEALARDLEVVIGEVWEGEPLVVLGHSMGGMGLIKYCGMFPAQLGERVRAVGLIDTCAARVIDGMLPEGAVIAKPALALIEEAALRAARRNPDAFDRIRRARADLVRIMVRLMGFGERAPAYKIEFVQKMMSRLAPDVLVWIVQEMRAMDLAECLDEIDIPALIVVGTRDRLTPVRASRQMAVAIPNAELITIPGSGHMPMLEQPKQFHARLRTFLENPGAVYQGRRIGALPQLAPD